VDDLGFFGKGNDPATMRGVFIRGALFYANVADAPHFERLLHVPADATWTAHQPGPEPKPQPLPPPGYRKPRFTAREIRLEIPLKILKKKSFGFADCSVTGRINPKYVGKQELS